MNTNFILPLTFLLITLTFISCNNSYINNIERGSGYKYQPGHPEFRVSSFSYYDIENEANLDLTIDIVYGSLIYKKPFEYFEASGNLTIEIFRETDSSSNLYLVDYPVKIRESEAWVTQSQNTLSVNRDFKLDHGSYTVEITLIDSLTNKKTTRTEQIVIPKLNSKISSITDIQVLAKTIDENSFSPVTTYDISESTDSLKFQFQILKKSSDKNLRLDMKLYRFESDSSFARRINSYNYSKGSIFYRGIDYNKKKLIDSRRRVLTDSSNVLIELDYLTLPRGNYRLEVVSSDIQEFLKGIDFSIKSENYPTLKTPTELAKPLTYLMTNENYQKLLDIKDQDSLKKEIDRFWLSNIENKSLAKSTLSLYYHRVEEANKLFSNFKEGWKTDMGMVYIIYGAPWSIKRSLNKMTWSYSYNLDDPERNFEFIAPKMSNKYFPFEHYVLTRNSFYYDLYYQQIQLWLSGKILTSGI